MTHTLLSLLSIFLGIISANFLGFIKAKYSVGFTSNTIAGVFGSIFFVKFFGRLGFSPFFIVQNDVFNVVALIINFTVSILGGMIALLITYEINKKIKAK